MAYNEHRKSADSLAARCAVITLSDTRTEQTDSSGALIRKLLEQAGHPIVDSKILPDEPRELESHLKILLQRDDVDAILTTGGTGISRRDQTIDAIAAMIDQPLRGFGELFRMLSWEQIKSGAMLSRAIAGIARGKVIFAMPGSTNACELAMTKLILPELKHMIGELRK